MMDGILDLGMWDVPYEDIEDVYTIDGPDGVSYLIIEVYGLHVVVNSDTDFDLVGKAMSALSEAAGIGHTAIAISPEDYDGEN